MQPFVDPTTSRQRPRCSASLALGLLSVVFVAALPASCSSAIEMHMLSPAVAQAAPGESLTIELALENASRSSVQGIEIDLTGLAGVANMTGGRGRRSTPSRRSAQVRPALGQWTPVSVVF
jgi:hypothetical protein